MTSIGVYHFVDGIEVEAWAESDTLGLMRQLKG